MSSLCKYTVLVYGVFRPGSPSRQGADPRVAPPTGPLPPAPRSPSPVLPSVKLANVAPGLSYYDP